MKGLVERFWNGSPANQDTIERGVTLAKKSSPTSRDVTTIQTGRKISRRRAIRRTTAASLTGIVLVSGGAALLLPHREHELSLEEILEAIKNPKPIIQTELDRINTPKNDNETALWTNLPATGTSENITAEELYASPDKKKIVDDNFNQMITGLKTSSNSLYNEAYTTITSRQKSLDLGIHPVPNNNKEYPFITTPQYDPATDKFFWTLRL